MNREDIERDLIELNWHIKHMKRMWFGSLSCVLALLFLTPSIYILVDEGQPELAALLLTMGLYFSRWPLWASVQIPRAMWQVNKVRKAFKKKLDIER